MIRSSFSTLAGLLLAMALAAPASAAQLQVNPGTNTGGTLSTGGGTSALMSEAECKRAGGRVASNPSCFSGKQCRGIMHQDCISKAQ